METLLGDASSLYRFVPCALVVSVVCMGEYLSVSLEKYGKDPPIQPVRQLCEMMPSGLEFRSELLIIMYVCRCRFHAISPCLVLPRRNVMEHCHVL